MNFITIATPHLGVANHTFIDLPTFLKDLILHNFIGKTGYDLNLSDDELLLYQMATDKKYLIPLSLFKSRRLYANWEGDFMVPFETAAIEQKRNIDIINQIKIPQHPAIIYHIKPENNNDNNNNVKKIKDEELDVELEEAIMIDEEKKKIMINKMISSLSPLFEKVYVSFPSPLPLAHNKIAAIERNGILSQFVAKVCGFSEGQFVMDHLSSLFVTKYKD